MVAVESGLGMMGGSGGHEFMALLSVGEDTLLLCPTCGYKANQEVATFRKEQALVEEQQDLEENWARSSFLCRKLEDEVWAQLEEEVLGGLRRVGEVAVADCFLFTVRLIR